MGSIIVLFIFSSSMVILASTEIVKKKLGARTTLLILGIVSFMMCFLAYDFYVLQIVPDFKILETKYFYDRAVAMASNS